MIVQKIINFCNETPHKQALVYGKEVVTYENLEQKIKEKFSIIANVPASIIFLDNASPLENLYGLLAANAAGKSAVFVPNTENKANLIEHFKNFKFAFYSDLLLEYNSKNSIPYSISTPHDLDIFLGVYTSGSTGSPNLIWKDYQAWVSAFAYQTNIFDVQPHHNLMVVDALAYSANLNAVLHQLWQGGTVHLISLNKAKYWPEYIQNQQINSFFLVPSHLRLLKNCKAVFEKVVSIVTAGEKLACNTAQKAMAIFPNARLTEYYGSAELGHITYHQNEAILQNGLSVGKPFPGVEVKIIEDKIVVESPYISPDYRHVKSNFDLGCFVNNELILIGREGRMFNRRGLNVFAQEIENAALSLPLVAEAIVLSPKKIAGQDQLVLLYTSQYNFQDNKNSKLILAELSAILHKTKLPKKAVEWLSFPKNMAGKIDITALKRTFEEASK